MVVVVSGGGCWGLWVLFVCELFSVVVGVVGGVVVSD